jgi:hypothetical protein
MVGNMLFRFTRIWVTLGALAALWGLTLAPRPEPRARIRPLGMRTGPVKILNFYANVGAVTMGEKALLCYGVENAKSVRISPTMQGVYPALNRCLEIVPERTTHYTIHAEGYDGGVATQSFTLPVQPPVLRQRPAQFAEVHYRKLRTQSTTSAIALSGI